MQPLQIDHRRGLSGCSASAENPGIAYLQLRFPGDNLGRMYLKQLGQFGQCLLAFDGCQGPLCLEAGAVCPACSLRHARS
jgi:hypothetical protein